MLDIRTGNNAVKVNPATGVAEHITVHGSDFYFAICAAMGASALACGIMVMKKPPHQRIFHYLCIALLMTACVAYYTMGSDLGYAAVDVEYMRSKGIVAGANRQVFYARYIDWFITTPLLLMDCLLTAGLPWPTIFMTIFADLFMVVTGLIGGLTVSNYKWGYFAAGCFAMIWVFYNILVVGKKNANALGADVNRLYLMISGLTVLLWTLYPIAWGLCEGGNVISSDSEAIFYGILDFFAKPVFTFLLLAGHSKLDYARFGLGREKMPYQLEAGLGENNTVAKDGEHGLAANTAATANVPHTRV
jgi:bacteriorhodopsin